MGEKESGEGSGQGFSLGTTYIWAWIILFWGVGEFSLCSVRHLAAS